MDEGAPSFRQLADKSTPLARRLLVIGENRLELLGTELQEERARLLRAVWLALWVGACGFLAALALNVALVLLLWNHSPVTVLLTLTALYAAVTAILYRRLTRMLRDWNMLSATIDQLRKDRECLEKNLT